MTLAQIADKKACGGVEGANTGRLGCLSLFGTPTHFLAMLKGTIIPKATTFDDAYIRPLVQKGTYIPVIDASSFEDISAADNYSTNTAGEKRLNLKGLPEYKLMFEEGHEFYKQLAKLEGYKDYDFIIGDDEGNWLVATTSTGDFTGFSAGHVTPELTKRKVQGGDSESKSLVVQFLNRLQFDQNYSILHADTLTWTPQELPQVNGVNLNFDVVPNDSNVVVTVSAVLSSDNNTPVEGLAAAVFVANVNAANNVIVSAVENTPGVYTITLTTAPTTGQVVDIDLWDSGLNVDVADSNNVLYRAILAAETTIA